MHYLLLLPLFFFLPSAAQDTLLVSEIDGQINLKSTGKGSYLYSSGNEPGGVLQAPRWLGMKGGASTGGKREYCWLQVTVSNDLPDSAFVDFLPLRADSAVLYIVRRDGPVERQVSGRFIRPETWLIPEQPEISSLSLASGQTEKVLLRLTGDRRKPFSPEKFFIQTRSHTLSQALTANRDHGGRIETNAFFFGAVVAMMFFFLLVYFRIREKSLLFYSLYLLGAAAYALIVSSLPYSRMAWAAGLDYHLAYKLNDPVQYLFLGAYVLFCIHLLDIDSRYPVLRKLMYTMAGALVSIGMLLLLVNFINYDYNLQKGVYVFARTILLPLSLVVIVWIALDVRSPIKWVFLVGCFFFAGGGVLAFLIDLGVFSKNELNPVIVFKTGMLLEIFCFSIALSYKLRLISEEKTRVKAAYMEQMELNRRLVSAEKERLEQMVARKTEEVMEANTLLERQKQQKLESDFNKRLSEMEMQALRSQMNPQFIFNSLNSIRDLVLTDNYQLANDYLMRFARFLRKILQNSRKHQIPLSEELDVIHLYLQLEKLCFGSLFEYTIVISPEIDAEDIMVPSMLLQPFVENALKQGIAPNLQKAGRITVGIGETETGYRYEIEDNGIGRQEGALKKAPGKKSSSGFKLISDRIELFNKNFNQNVLVSFEDLKNADGEATGTKVVITHELESHD